MTVLIQFLDPPLYQFAGPCRLHVGKGNISGYRGKRRSCIELPILVRPEQVFPNLGQHLQMYIRLWTAHTYLRLTLSSRSFSRSSNVLSMVIRRELLTSFTPPALKRALVMT